MRIFVLGQFVGKVVVSPITSSCAGFPGPGTEPWGVTSSAEKAGQSVTRVGGPVMATRWLWESAGVMVAMLSPFAFAVMLTMLVSPLTMPKAGSSSNEPSAHWQRIVTGNFI